jgi:hypothetical protein
MGLILTLHVSSTAICVWYAVYKALLQNKFVQQLCRYVYTPATVHGNTPVARRRLWNNDKRNPHTARTEMQVTKISFCS